MGLNPRQFGALVSDTTPIAALVYLAASTDHWARNTVARESISIMAYFTDNSGFTDPASVSFNGTTMTRKTTGTYQVDYSSMPSAPYLLNWNANSYLGSNLSTSMTMPVPLLLTNFIVADTISKSIGKVCTYSGNTGGRLVIRVGIDDAHTSFYISPDSVPDLVPVVSSKTDDGTFSLSSTILAQLPVNRYYWVIISHETYDTVPYQGRNVGRYAVYEAGSWFYLAP